MLSSDYLSLFVKKLITMSNKEGFNMKNESIKYIELFKTQYGTILNELSQDENSTPRSLTPTTIIPQQESSSSTTITTTNNNNHPTSEEEEQANVISEGKEENSNYSFSTLNKHKDIILSTNSKIASSTKNEYCYVLLNFCIEEGIYIIKYQLIMDEGNYGDIMFGLTKQPNNNEDDDDCITPLFKKKNTIVFDGNEGTKYVDGMITAQTGLRVREGAEIECRIDVNNQKYILKLDNLEDEEIYSGDVKGYYPFVEFFASPLMTIQLMDVKHLSN